MEENLFRLSLFTLLITFSFLGMFVVSPGDVKQQKTFDKYLKRFFYLTLFLFTMGVISSAV